MTALSQTADDYLRLRRALGHKLADAGRLLPRLVAYLESKNLETITIEAAMAWAQQPDAAPTSTVWVSRMAVARGFARHLAGRDSRTEVPPVGILPSRRHRRVPYIYSATEIASLMAQAHLTIRSEFRAATLETLFGLLAATGMRVGEAIRLDNADLDWADRLAVVRSSKFGKSREVPLQASTVAAMATYARRRDQLQLLRKAPSFFVSIIGTRLLYADILITFRQLAEAAGIGAQSSVSLHIHDLRHSFAVHTLVDWYRNGEDVQARLPSLATYLGHVEPRSTYWYLSGAPELLGLAAGRLDAFEEVRP
jgi:site-specific recombinase XerD